jgi:hypothetical protein
VHRKSGFRAFRLAVPGEGFEPPKAVPADLQPAECRLPKSRSTRGFAWKQMHYLLVLYHACITDSPVDCSVVASFPPWALLVQVSVAAEPESRHRPVPGR